METSLCFLDAQIILVTIMTICEAEITQNVFDKNTIRVSDMDYDTTFTGSGTTKSRIRCMAMCLTNDYDTYYIVDTRQCGCQAAGPIYSPVTTGSNYVDTYNTGKMYCKTNSCFI